MCTRRSFSSPSSPSSMPMNEAKHMPWSSNHVLLYTLPFTELHALFPLRSIHQFVLQNEHVYVQVSITNQYSWSCGFRLFSFSFKKWSLAPVFTCFFTGISWLYYRVGLTRTLQLNAWRSDVSTHMYVQGSLVPRPCVFVACSTKFMQKAWAHSSCDVCRSLHHDHFTENQWCHRMW